MLADQVGLGKTVQLALAAQLMALYGDKPVLIIVPKTLLAQWQEEIFSLLHLPSAIWLGSGWQDEQGMFYQAEGVSSILRCPRRVGIVSQGLVTRRTEARSLLLTQDYECVVLDEAHRARRRNAAKNPDTHKADANFLLAFLQEISPRTHSLLLATATPVQTHTIEAYDLLTALSPASYAPAYGILGDNMNSLWRKESQTMLDILCDAKPIPRNAVKIWDLMRDPLPLPDASDTSAAARQLRSLRQRLDLSDTTFVLQDYTWLHRQRHTIQDRVHELYQSYDFLHTENPYIRHIIRRSFKTGEQVGILFDVSTARGPVALSGIDDYVMSPDESRILLQTETNYIYRRSFTAQYYIYSSTGTQEAPRCPQQARRQASAQGIASPACGFA